jgi:hypothetical protein
MVAVARLVFGNSAGDYLWAKESLPRQTVAVQKPAQKRSQWPA